VTGRCAPPNFFVGFEWSGRRLNRADSALSSRSAFPFPGGTWARGVSKSTSTRPSALCSPSALVCGRSLSETETPSNARVRCCEGDYPALGTDAEREERPARRRTAPGRTSRGQRQRESTARPAWHAAGRASTFAKTLQGFPRAYKGVTRGTSLQRVRAVTARVAGPLMGTLPISKGMRPSPKRGRSPPPKVARVPLQKGSVPPQPGSDYPHSSTNPPNLDGHRSPTGLGPRSRRRASTNRSSRGMFLTVVRTTIPRRAS
jgi:hypothetical protein